MKCENCKVNETIKESNDLNLCLDCYNTEVRNQEIEDKLKKGLFSWENSNTISIDGSCILLDISEIGDE